MIEVTIRYGGSRYRATVNLEINKVVRCLKYKLAAWFKVSAEKYQAGTRLGDEIIKEANK